MLEAGFLDTLINLSKNLAVLTCGVAAYCWVRRGALESEKRWKLVAEAMVLSLLAAYSMFSGISAMPGLTYDARFILIALASLFSGPLVGGAVTLTVIAVRLYMGGLGMSSGILGALVVLGVVGAYRDHMLRVGRPIRYVELVVASTLTSLSTFTGWIFLPWDILRPMTTDVTTVALFTGNIVGLVILGMLVIWDDNLKGLQRSLADGDARFHAVIDNLPISVGMRDRNGIVTLLNRRYRDVYGPEINRFIGRDRNELRNFLFQGAVREVHAADENEVATTGRAITRHVQDLMINGHERSLLITTFCVPDAMDQLDSVAVIGVDVSEIRRREREMETLQTQLVQSGKMKAVGQLAGGIAHDFNNLLAAMSGFASFLSEDLADRPSEQFHANRILDVCERAKTLVTQVLAFARADRADRQLIDVAPVIAQARDFMRATLPATIKLSLETDGEPVWLHANTGQISQLVVNLGIRGSHALEGRSGSIRIGLGCVDGLTMDLARSPEPGLNCHRFGIPLDQPYVQITVSDDGAGMDQYTIEHIMEPFFTTLGSSDGSGLGMSIVHGIVAAYAGTYVIKSGVGIGTIFEIYLPLAAAAEPALVNS